MRATKKAYESDQTTEAFYTITKTQHTGRQAILCRVLAIEIRYLNYTMNCWYRVPLLIKNG